MKPSRWRSVVSVLVCIGFAGPPLRCGPIQDPPRSGGDRFLSPRVASTFAAKRASPPSAPSVAAGHGEVVRADLRDPATGTKAPADARDDPGLHREPATETKPPADAKDDPGLHREPATGAKAPSEGVAGAAADRASVELDLTPYTKEIEAIRGLAFEGPVASGARSLDEFRRFVEKDLDLELPPARATCIARALGRLGLLPERFDLRRALSDMLVTQVAAYYDPQGRTFYVLRPDLPEPIVRATVVHELTHALQDQRFGLAARIEALREVNNDDVENAFRFLTEGEATYVMTLAALRAQGIDLEKSRSTVDRTVDAAASLVRNGLGLQLDAAQEARNPDGHDPQLHPELAAIAKGVLSYPEYLYRILFDPYAGGQQAIHRIYRSGGWGAVNALWKNPPASTELFLHPEKLAGGPRDEPVKVAIPDVSSAIGPGYAPACENTLGELETEILLETALSAVATDAATSKEPKGGQGSGRRREESADPDDSRPAPGRREPVADASGRSTDGGAAAPDAGGRQIGESADAVRRARLAAAGWGGDRYRSFEKDGGGTIVVWKTVWDTERDAIEFEKTMRAAARAISLSGGRDHGFLLERAGSQAIVIAGASAPRARAILAALRASSAGDTTRSAR